MPEERKKKIGGWKGHNAPEGYYTAKEAQERLTMTKATFHRNVGKQGLQLRRYVPRGMKEGFYSKQEIDLIATLREKGLVENSKLPPTVFRAAFPYDVYGITEVLQSLGWEKSQPDAALRIQWYGQNPEIDHVVLQGSIIMGYVSGTPYTPEIMQERLYGRIDAKDIKPEDILPFEDGGTYDIFVGLVERKKPESHPEQFARFGARLILGFRQFIMEDLAKRGIRIRLLLAHSAEPDGQKFADALGFVQQGQGKYPIYILDMEHSEEEWVKRYRELWDT